MNFEGSFVVFFMDSQRKTWPDSDTAEICANSDNLREIFTGGKSSLSANSYKNKPAMLIELVVKSVLHTLIVLS